MKPWIDERELMPWLPRGAWPHVIAPADHGRLQQGLAAAGFEVHSLDEGIHTEKEFHVAIARVFAFPDYYGKNWDAFYDCIRDWAEPGEVPTALIWSGWDQWLREDVPGFLHTIAMLADVAKLERQLTIFMVGPLRLDQPLTAR